MLADAWGTELGLSEELLSTMALVQLPLSGEAQQVQERLYQQGIEVPVKQLDERLYVRLSAHIYNHMEVRGVGLKSGVLEGKSS